MAKKVRLSSAQSTVRAAVSRALADALITGINNASEEGHPLTELQQIALATMHIMSYDEALKACDNLEVDELIERRASMQ